MNLDREIEQLLAVDHSPELAARIRARVAAEPAPRSSWFAWALVPAGAGLTAAAVLTTLWFSADSAPVAVTPPSSISVSAAAAVQASPPGPVAPVFGAGGALELPTPVRANRPMVPAREANAEILISPEDDRAFRLLLTRVGEGLVVALPEGEADDSVAGPAWIEIAPVVIEPIAQLAQDEGGRQ